MATVRKRYRLAMSIDLEGTQFRFVYWWNSVDATTGSDGSWWMSVEGDDGTILLRRAKLVLGTDILSRYRYNTRLPLGKIDVEDTSGEGREAGPDDLGERVVVKYRASDAV